MENKHTIENLMKTTMENIRNMIDVSTVIGDTIETKDGKSIIPISKVSFGFGSGGTDINNLRHNNDNHNDISKRDYPFGGGSGAGVTIKPVAFLVINGDSVKLLHVEDANSSEKIIEAVPEVLNLIKSFSKKDKKEEE